MIRRYAEVIAKLSYDYQGRKVPNDILRTVAYIYGVRYDKIRTDVDKGMNELNGE